jgi:hypothetical protein
MTETLNNEDIFYVKNTYHQVRTLLKRNEDISGTVYSGNIKFKALLQTMPENTLIRFWQNYDRSKNPICNHTARWDKRKNKIKRIY